MPCRCVSGGRSGAWDGTCCGSHWASGDLPVAPARELPSQLTTSGPPAPATEERATDAARTDISGPRRPDSGRDLRRVPAAAPQCQPPLDGGQEAALQHWPNSTVRSRGRRLKTSLRHQPADTVWVTGQSGRLSAAGPAGFSQTTEHRYKSTPRRHVRIVASAPLQPIPAC